MGKRNYQLPLRAIGSLDSEDPENHMKYPQILSKSFCGSMSTIQIGKIQCQVPD